MINFRFHIASLIAVFLALAVGVVMGSTLIDRAIVDGLHNQIDKVERRADSQRAENARLQGEVQRLQAFVDTVAPWAVSGTMSNPVALLAERGIDADQVKAQVELLRRGGGTTTGILWLEPSWNLTDDQQTEVLRRAVGSTARTRQGVRRDAIGALAARLVTGAPPLQPDVLPALIDAHFVTFEGVGADAEPFTPGVYPGADARMQLLGGPAAQITVKSFARDFAQAFVGGGAPPVVGEVFAETEHGGARGEWLAPIRSDAQLAVSLSTVDDVDLTEGRIASVLALSQVPVGSFGAYGYGTGAKQPLPEPAPVAG